VTAVVDRPPERTSTESVPLADERAFRAVVRGCAIVTLLLMGLIALFLLLRSWPALHRAGFSFLTEKRWLPDVNHFGVAALLSGTVVIGCIALLVAVPLALGASLFINEYAPRRLRRLLVSMIDLMAAVPSIVYGLWGFFFLQPRMIGLSRWLSAHLGGVLPFLHVHDADTPSSFTSSAFIAGTVVGIVVVPTVTSVMREVFSQAPVAEREAALALGSTKWGMIRTVVIPFGRGGIIGGAMLGLGRALGETIAVYLIISPILDYTTHPLQSGSNTIAAFIASRSTESSSIGLAGLLGAGLVLFLLTLLVNSIAAVIVARSRSGAVTE
jgi:phosphate transport system permease protein